MPNGSVLGALYVQMHGKYKDKTKQNPPEVEEAREGKPHNRVKQPPPRPWGSPGSDRGRHHGLAMVATGCGGLVSFRALRFGLLVLHLGPQVFAFLGVFWASSCYHLLILMALTSLAWIHLKHFSQNVGLNHKNLQ